MRVGRYHFGFLVFGMRWQLQWGTSHEYWRTYQFGPFFMLRYHARAAERTTP